MLQSRTCVRCLTRSWLPSSRRFCPVPALAAVASLNPSIWAWLNPTPASPIEWEVKNRFRLFRREADFQRHVVASRARQSLAAEQMLDARHRRPRLGAGHGRAVCASTAPAADGDLRARRRARKLSRRPRPSASVARLVGAVPPGATCAWGFDDGTARPAGQRVLLEAVQQRAAPTASRPSPHVDITRAGRQRRAARRPRSWCAIC